MQDMNITYKRSGNNNYMIIPFIEQAPIHEKKMLENNDIDFLLSFFSVTTEEGESFWYDITGKKSIKHVLESGDNGREQVLSIFLGILKTVDRLSEYLISGEHVLLNEETLFVKSLLSKDEIFMCYNPDGNLQIKDSLRSLTEYILSVMDHEDNEFVEAMYDIYQSLCDDSFSADNAKKTIYALFETGEESSSLYGTEEDGGSSTSEGITDRSIGDEYSGFGEKLDEIFDDEEEETILKRISDFFKSLPDEILNHFNKKKEEYFPPKDLEEDFIYEPKKYIPEPTVMLTNQDNLCLGKLNYEGEGNEKSYTLSGEHTSIGSRDEGNDVLLNSSVVSRHHAKIHKRGAEYYIEDLNSTNGTFVNGKPLEVGREQKLNPMDKIVFADVPYRIV